MKNDPIVVGFRFSHTEFDNDGQVSQHIGDEGRKYEEWFRPYVGRSPIQLGDPDVVDFNGQSPIHF